MTPGPVVIPPATPSDLLTYIIALHKYPTVVLVGSSKDDFIEALTRDVTQIQQSNEPDPGDDGLQHHVPSHPLCLASLMQVAVSRHIQIVFIPTVTHLQAYLSTFSVADSNITPPPNYTASSEQHPSMVIYGLLGLHRDWSEWSAQGISNSLAALVECAAREAFAPVIVEPKGVAGHEELDQILAEKVPLLSEASMRDGAWTERTVELGRVLGRWFDCGAQVSVTERKTG